MTGLTLAFTGKIYFSILGLGLDLDTFGLVYIPGKMGFGPNVIHRTPTARSCLLRHPRALWLGNTT